MRKVTLRIPRQQIERVDEIVDRGEYPSRSEAIRDAIRGVLDESSDDRPRHDTQP